MSLSFSTTSKTTAKLQAACSLLLIDATRHVASCDACYRTTRHVLPVRRATLVQIRTACLKVGDTFATPSQFSTYGYKFSVLSLSSNPHYP